VNELHESSARDHVTLQMENELLALEVRYLRARLKSMEHEVAGGTRLSPSELQQRFTELSAEHRRVLGDMRWMLRRLNESPIGPMLRRMGGFRALLERYPQPPT
jgi:hypothetical protein